MDDVWKPGAEGPDPSGEVSSLRPVTAALLAVQLAAIAARVLTLSSTILLELVEPGALEAEMGPASGPGLALVLVVGFSAIGLVGLALLGVPVWVYWHWRAAENLRVLGTKLQYTPGWHAGWWFVPFANLVVPYRAMVELYVGSTGTGPAPALFASSARSAPPYFVAWWTCWLVGNIAGNLSSRLSGPASIAIDLVAAPVAIAATLLYLKFVREISAGQRRLAAARVSHAG